MNKLKAFVVPLEKGLDTERLRQQLLENQEKEKEKNNK